MTKLFYSVVPVGTRVRYLIPGLSAALLVSAVTAVCSYLYSFRRMYNNLYYFTDGEMLRRSEYMMVQFRVVREDCFNVFTIFLLCLAALAVYNYFSHYTGSKSIYTMLRVGRGELIKRCVTVPLIFAAAALLVMLILNFSWYLHYIFKVPEDALYPDYADGLWRFLL